MSNIVPAIIPKDFFDLEEKLGVIAGQVPMAHIDVLDGSFTDSKSWPYAGDISGFLRITNETEGFPYWEDLSFEAHLMVRDVPEIVEDWIKAGAERLIIHYEAFDNESDLSQFLAVIKNRFQSATSYLGVEAGLAVNFETPIEKILPHVLEADFIHLMSIKNIGRQGEEFDPGIYEKITELKKEYPDTIISVDGGVKLEHVRDLKEAGVERIVVGSAIFGVEDSEEALYDFLEELNF